MRARGSDRLARVNSLLQQALAEAVPLVKDPRVQRPLSISVAAVRTTPDLRQAKVYLMMSGAPEEQQAALSGLQNARGFLRSRLGQSGVRLRYLPELQFLIDETPDSAERVERILRELADERASEQSAQQGGRIDRAEAEQGAERQASAAEDAGARDPDAGS